MRDGEARSRPSESRDHHRHEPGHVGQRTEGGGGFVAADRADAAALELDRCREILGRVALRPYASPIR